jgi:hypothetical protein
MAGKISVMTVDGHEIAACQIQAGLSAIGGRFTLHTIKSALVRAGVPIGAAERVADRLLQRERRAGRIRYSGGVGGYWSRVDA